MIAGWAILGLGLPYAQTDAFVLPGPGSRGISRRLAVGTTSALDNHIALDEAFPGLQRIHSLPDIYIIKDLLTPAECESMVQTASAKGLDQSPVVYAGWTQDVYELLKLLALGPITWCSLFRVWLTANAGASRFTSIAEGMEVWIGGVLASGVLLLGWAKKREMDLGGMRTSTSTTVHPIGTTMQLVKLSLNQSIFRPSCPASTGSEAFVTKAEGLLKAKRQVFEAPTVIRYEAGQVLAPHYDANRAAAVEDSDRGGQTLATLIVYLNTAAKGGKTRFGKLNLEVEPQEGSALLFFPANKLGEFDDRMEHEGMEAEAEKWIARIWMHETNVPAPYGMG
ncbi:unnamed protein product [Chrysoparadoxa australica]